MPAERRRFEHALRQARRELEEIALRVGVTVGKSAAAIFMAHALLLEDSHLRSPILRLIEEEHWMAESAVVAALEEYAHALPPSGIAIWLLGQRI